MIDLVLLIARLLFVALLYLFLFAIMRTGIGTKLTEHTGSQVVLILY